MGVYDQEAVPDRDEPVDPQPVPEPEQPDVDPNPEPPDVDGPTPAHPDSTPDDEPAAETQDYGIRGVEAFIG